MREGGVAWDAKDAGWVSKRSSERMETAQAQSEKRWDVHMQHSELRERCGEEGGCIYLLHARTDKPVMNQTFNYPRLPITSFLGR
jgi:hypothetical protein